MNSRDLRAIQHVHALTQMGIDSLKIEGRTKSFYYCARTAQVYRRVIDAAKRGEPFELSALYDLDKLANRGYTEGFLRRHTHDMYQNYETGASVSDQQQLVGEAIGTTENGEVVIDVKNRFALGDRPEWMTPKGNIDFTLTHMSTLKGETTECAPGSGHKVSIALPKEAAFDGFGILLRYLAENETTRGFQPAAAEAS
jgi:putative protease